MERKKMITGKRETVTRETVNKLDTKGQIYVTNMKARERVIKRFL